jgi:hypothetical protein
MEEAIEKGRAEVEGVKRLREKIDGLMGKDIEDGQDITNGHGVDGLSKRMNGGFDQDKDWQNALWRALGKE